MSSFKFSIKESGRDYWNERSQKGIWPSGRGDLKVDIFENIPLA